MTEGSFQQDFDFETELAHIGILRRSGRYPWGSGENPHQRNKDFLAYVDDLRKKGLSEVDIAKGMGITTTQLRAAKKIAKTASRKQAESQALRLKDSGMSNMAIGKEMGINESSVRALLDPAMQARNDVLTTTSEMLKGNITEDRYLDFGVGLENQLGISPTMLSTAVAMLEEEGYTRHYVKVQQLGTGEYTTIKVLAPPGTPYLDVVQNQERIKGVTEYSEDNGRTYLGIETPANLDSSRVAVRYGSDGGADKDGVIELRRGVEDVSLGQARYAQVRIAVDGTHYLKGMAMYSDNMPDGVDVLFNTNKEAKASKLDAMKSMKDDGDNPFGSVIRQKHYIDADGNRQLSKLNIVGTKDPDGVKTPGEEGGWYNWSRNLSSQMLSKQTPALAKKQLDLSYEIKKDELDDILALTNPSIKKKLLQSYADGADSSAVHLKAAGLPRTRNHVLLPINSLRDNEIYAPNYNNGEKVVLIRHPHGGTFEIPELTVNNRNKEANSLISQAKDAVGINSKVAARLSGADFDGDTVLVIPNNSKSVRTSPALRELKNFDPQTAYPKYEGMKPMSPRTKQLLMGDASNLITDMTIMGASNSEIARAVKHSMVVIDAEKHKLNYKQSHKDQGIAELKAKYQGGARKGAATLVSRSSSELRLDHRTPRKAKDGGPVDAKTGRKVYVDSGESYVDKRTGKVVKRTTSSTRMAEASDARTLMSGVSGTTMEATYANHANKLKALANQARKAELMTRPIPYDPVAKKAYANEVATLNAKLNVALKNKPLERQAQLLGRTTVNAKRQATPGMEASEVKKISGQALNEARSRVGAKKQRIDITDREWEAIQKGAISGTKLNNILSNSDLDQIKQRANPRERTVMSDAKMARARTMLAAGYMQSEVASALGVPASTLNSSLQ